MEATDGELPVSIFSSDPRIHNLRVLESQLTTFRQATGVGKYNEATAVLCKSISTILDRQERWEVIGDGTQTKLRLPTDTKYSRMFIHNDRTYRFDAWEFPEFTEWADRMSNDAEKWAREGHAEMSKDLALRIEARAMEALAILETAAGVQSK